MNNGKKKNGFMSIAPWLSVGAVWFGSHVGPGTASGNQVASYTSGYGKFGLFIGIIAMTVLGVCIYYAIEYSRLLKTTNFKVFADNFYAPYNKVFSTLFDFMYLAKTVLVIGSCLATGAAALQQQFNFPTVVSLSALCLITIILTIFGGELVRRSSTVMTVIILAAITIIIVIGLSSPAADFMGHWNNAPTIPQTLTVKPWTLGIVSGLVYAGFQSIGMMVVTLSNSDALRSRKDSLKASIAGIILNSFIICATSLLLFSFPDVLGDYFDPNRTSTSFLPMLEVANRVGNNFIVILYITILETAIVSSLVGYIFGTQNRIRSLIPMQNGKKKDFLIAVVFMIISIFVSQLGLDWIINTGVNFLGRICIFTVILPTILLGHKKVKNFAAEHAVTE